MKKLLYFSLLVIISLSFFIGCLAEPEPAVVEEEPAQQEPQPEPQPEPKPEEPVVVEPPPPMEEWVIIDHKTKDFGGQVPDWVTMTAIDLESQDKYKDYFVFIIDHVGKDLNGIELWARGFSAPSEVARMVSTRVEDKFVGAAAGDMDMLETYMEEVVKTMSEAEFAGIRTEDSFWVKKQNKANTNQIEYRYLFLITVPRSEIEIAIDRAFGDADAVAPRTEEEQTARDRVKEAFDDF
jgi:hypothetical protein